MSRAFVLEQTIQSTRKAEKFGHVVLLYERMQDYPNPLRRPQDFQSILVCRLANEGFDPDEDFIVVTGRMTAVVILVAAVVAAFGSARLLLYEMDRGEYVEVPVEAYTTIN